MLDWTQNEEERIRALLAGIFIASFVGISLVWTFISPKLPGDTAGMIIGGFLSVLGNLGGYYWSNSKKKDQPNGTVSPTTP